MRRSRWFRAPARWRSRLSERMWCRQTCLSVRAAQVPRRERERARRRHRWRGPKRSYPSGNASPLVGWPTTALAAKRGPRCELTGGHGSGESAAPALVSEPERRLRPRPARQAEPMPAGPEAGRDDPRRAYFAVPEVRRPDVRGVLRPDVRAVRRLDGRAVRRSAVLVARRLADPGARPTAVRGVHPVVVRGVLRPGGREVRRVAGQGVLRLAGREVRSRWGLVLHLGRRTQLAR